MPHKGFSFDLKSENTSRSGLEFKAAHLDFEPSSVSNELWYVAHTDPEENKAPRFIGISAAAHALMFAGLMVISGPLFETPETETVTIEIAETSGASWSAPKFAPQTTAPKVAPPQAAAAPEKISKDDIVVAKPRAMAKPAPPAKTAKPQTVKAAPKIAKTPSVARVQPMTTVSEVEVPASIDELNAPELDETQFEAKIAADLEEGELEKSFAKVDHEQNKGISALADTMNREVDNHTAADLGALDELDRENRMNAAAVAAQAEALNRRNAQALAAARAGEEAAAARRKAALDAAAARGRAQAGKGSGARGKPIAGAASGSPTGIRQLENLRQKPGNPRPAYSESERFAKQSGEVVFLAYITREGYPTNFRQVRSTGHANLDGKTLEALKRWKFYPGQEGWVEIPFRWDLRGGPQETSALARRKLSRK